jgi:N-hydroxyarylamine O-acetyltransferase
MAAVAHGGETRAVWKSARLDGQLRSAYLRRLGVDARPPSIDALQELHRRHVERVPYETMWIHAGESWGIDPLDSAIRIARESRGGYCYHLNGAFGALLLSLGYAVRGHAGGVYGGSSRSADAAGNHLVLTVSGLPTDENSSGIWYIDVGLGDALHHALPLAAGTYLQEPFRLTLDAPEANRGAWHLTHDPKGGFAGMSWTAAGADWRDLLAKHNWLATSPDSGFVQVAMAERRDATGVDVIRGLVLSRLGTTARSDEPLMRRDEWFAALADVFDLCFTSSAPEALDHLWTRVLGAHLAWERQNSST